MDINCNACSTCSTLEKKRGERESENRKERGRKVLRECFALYVQRRYPRELERKRFIISNASIFETRDDLNFNSAYNPASCRGKTSKLRVYVRGINYDSCSLVQTTFREATRKDHRAEHQLAEDTTFVRVSRKVEISHARRSFLTI